MTLSLTVLSLIFAGALALGAGTLAGLMLDLAHVYVARGLGNRRRAARRRMQEFRQPAPDAPRLDEAVLREAGVAGVSWRYWQLTAGAAGTALTLLLFPPSGPLRWAGALAAAVPWFVKRYLMEQGRRRIQAQVRAFIADLRLGLALGGSLGQTLAQQQGKGVLYERLGLYVKTRLTSSAGHEVLRWLARDLRSRDFDDLIFRLQAAERGAKSYEAALAEAAEHVSLEAHSRTMRNLKAAPVRLVVPTILTLFAPTIVMGMYPLVARVIEGISR